MIPPKGALRWLVRAASYQSIRWILSTFFDIFSRSLPIRFSWDLIAIHKRPKMRLSNFPVAESKITMDSAQGPLLVITVKLKSILVFSMLRWTDEDELQQNAHMMSLFSTAVCWMIYSKLSIQKISRLVFALSNLSVKIRRYSNFTAR